jgi:periplasmic copper chaperone A
MNVSKWMLGLVLAALAPAAVQAQAALLEFDQAWIRAAPPATPVMAGYVSIRNPGLTEVSVASVESETFATTELHEMRMVGQVMRMRPLRSLPVEPEMVVKLEPGGLHLMLMQPVRELAVGDRVEVTFVLADGRRQPVVFDVLADAPLAP